MYKFFNVNFFDIFVKENVNISHTIKLELNRLKFNLYSSQNGFM